MRHVRDVIRLKSAGMPTREIARRVGTAPTVRLTIHRFEAAGLTWPLPDEVTDALLEARLFASAGAGPGTRRGHRRQAEPDWAAVHRELEVAESPRGAGLEAVSAANSLYVRPCFFNFFIRCF
jgi:transposase